MNVKKCYLQFIKKEIPPQLSFKRGNKVRRISNGGEKALVLIERGLKVAYSLVANS